jgi:hypothetical protein
MPGFRGYIAAGKFGGPHRSRGLSVPDLLRRMGTTSGVTRAKRKCTKYVLDEGDTRLEFGSDETDEAADRDHSPYHRAVEFWRRLPSLSPLGTLPTMFTFSYPCTATSTALVLAIPIQQRR